MSSQAIPFITTEQYLEIERKAASRSEYLNGERFAMAGGIRNHARSSAFTAPCLASANTC